MDATASTIYAESRTIFSAILYKIQNIAEEESWLALSSKTSVRW
jgi:hypothetical protein